ncbi:hypothetical protein [Bartonella queenslandensis]|uniref:hypothetical protein n=1 Tax=Bartonella queenslandensis TaxID=481138 RepID=UPI0002ED1F25|nr:hypothetical protein [Bartonella queenslandensis]
MIFEEEGKFSNKKSLPLPVILQKRENSFHKQYVKILSNIKKSKVYRTFPMPYESKIAKDLVTSITI